MTKELTLESMRLWIASFAHRVAIIRRAERERCAKVARNYGAYEVERQILALEDEK